MQYFLPQYKILSPLFQAEDVDMPQSGTARFLPYRFNPLAPMDVMQLTRVIHDDTLLWGITGNSTGGSGGLTNVFAQIIHVHNGQYLPIGNKPAPLDNLAGSASRKMPILPTYFVPAGDSLMVEVRSLDRTNNLNVELNLFGMAIDWERLDQYQKSILDVKRMFLEKIQPPNRDVIGDQAPAAASPLVRGPSFTVYPAPGAAAVVIFSYQVPPGQRARIFEHALQHIGGNAPELSGSGVIWRFLVNGWPLPGLGAQTAQIGAFNTPDRVVIWLTENDLFQVTVEIPAAGLAQGGSSGYRINGWTSPMLASPGGMQ